MDKKEHADLIACMDDISEQVSDFVIPLIEEGFCLAIEHFMAAHNLDEEAATEASIVAQTAGLFVAVEEIIGNILAGGQLSPITLEALETRMSRIWDNALEVQDEIINAEIEHEVHHQQREFKKPKQQQNSTVIIFPTHKTKH